MQNKILATALVLFSVSIAAAKAPDENRLLGLFGPEFTFTKNGERPGDEEYNKVKRRMMDHLIEGQPEGAKFKMEGSKFISPNGWWFTLNRDPGVFEVQMSPLSLEQIRRFKDDIQDAIFSSMANEGYFPWDYMGGGHINMDTGIFGEDILLARNFIVDFLNHNELSMGALGYSTISAGPFLVFKPEHQAKALEVIDKVDAGEYGGSATGIARFFKDLDSIFTSAHGRLRNGGHYKHTELHFGTAGLLEIRAVRPQANMSVWIHQLELIEGRINYLRRIRTPIPYKPVVPLVSYLNILESDPQSHVWHPPIDSQQALRSFYMYVSQSGLPWTDHRDYLWPDWKKRGEDGSLSPLEIFEKSVFFKTRENLRTLKERGRQQQDCQEQLKDLARTPA